MVQIWKMIYQAKKGTFVKHHVVFFPKLSHIPLSTMIVSYVEHLICTYSCKSDLVSSEYIRKKLPVIPVVCAARSLTVVWLVRKPSWK